MNDDAAMWEKAAESLAGAESEFAAGRYANCANRCYYACFQAAIAALMRESIRPAGTGGTWGHDFVQAQFNGILINRRKRYPERLRDVLPGHLTRRETADYSTVPITQVVASRMLQRTRDFLAAIDPQGGTL